MEKQYLSGSEQKIQEYVNRIQGGESKDSIFEGLSESFKVGIDNKLTELKDGQESIEIQQPSNQDNDQMKIEELKNKLGIKKTSTCEDSDQKKPPINYIDITIDDDFMHKNLMPNGGLRMKGGQANWNGEVDLMRYTISEKLSSMYRVIAEDKVEKFNKGQEKTYQHESHHIRNRENGLTPHLAASNLREFLAFRVLDELSAFAAGELYDEDLTVENILIALHKSEKSINDSYYGDPFVQDAKWYISQQGDKSDIFLRQINQEKYHQIMRQYFKIKGEYILTILNNSGKMSDFTKIVNNLIIKLDDVMNSVNLDN